MRQTEHDFGDETYARDRFDRATKEHYYHCEKRVP